MSAQFAVADAHQHIWDPRANYHPWLCDQPPVAFRYGNNCCTAAGNRHKPAQALRGRISVVNSQTGEL